MKVAWPDGKKFAFSIIDDTDFGTIENTKLVYDFLLERGLPTTKTVWVFRGSDGDDRQGSTCEDLVYLSWLKELQASGVEIALHNASWDSSEGQQLGPALDRFREHFGQDPPIHCNHSQCRDNIYWGDARLSGARRLVYNALTLGRYAGRFRGHLPGDRSFWGDLCRERVRFVRSFTFEELNAFRVCPVIPYRDATRPYVRRWFPATEARRVEDFVRLVTKPALERLEEEGGLCIMATHLALGFQEDGVIQPGFRQAIDDLVERGGWLAPAGKILNFLESQVMAGDEVLTPSDLACLEWRWLAARVPSRTAGLLRELGRPRLPGEERWSP